ncbi:MAG: hypothetical protein LBM99_03965 [Bacillales bacterium]|jgi:hypothetical protein|nr:hypothetical protein [Bacillales bacterium]
MRKIIGLVAVLVGLVFLVLLVIDSIDGIKVIIELAGEDADKLKLYGDIVKLLFPVFFEPLLLVTVGSIAMGTYDLKGR